MESKSPATKIAELESIITKIESFLRDHTPFAYLINFVLLFIGCCLLSFGLGFNMMSLICLGVPTIAVSLIIWLFIGVRYSKFGMP